MLSKLFLMTLVGAEVANWNLIATILRALKILVSFE